MTYVQEKLFKLQDEKYRSFHSKLIPTVDEKTVIGVRMPEIRKLAKRIEKEPCCEDFLESLPHKYYDENILHSVIIAGIKDYHKCLEAVEKFLPYIDNWAVNDSLKPKALCKNKEEF